MTQSAQPSSATNASPCTPQPAAPKLNVVVTGGSSGIGASIVRAFARGGHRVLLTYLTGKAAAQNLCATFTSVTAVHLDQADVQSVASFSAAAANWAGADGVHVLINNAALGSATVQRYVERSAWSENTDSNSNEMSEHLHKKSRSKNYPHSTLRMLERAQRDQALVSVNALGPLWVTDALSDLLHQAAYKQSGARAVIIFIGSVGGGSSAVFPEYCAADLMSKAAMTYLSKHIAARYVREPVDVLCVSPGATETDMFRESTLTKVADPNRFIDSMPKRRLIQPDDIAETVLWLSVSSPPGLFHGAVLDASMGLAVRPGLQTETENSR